MAEKEMNTPNGAARRLIGCAFIFTGGLNSILTIRSGGQIGAVSYLFIIAGAALLLYGVWTRARS